MKKRSSIGGSVSALFMFLLLTRVGSFFGTLQPSPAAGSKGVAPSVGRPGGISIASSPVRAKAPLPLPELPPLGTPLTPEQVFAFASPSVVMIEVRDAQMRPIGQGSGFFVPGDGLLVTNYHVIDGASFATVKTVRGQTLFVEGIVAGSEKADLALLKVRGGGADQPVLRLSEGPPPQVGTRVFAIGNPQGLTNSLSEGLVSGHRGDVDGHFAGAGVGDASMTVIQTSAAISPGSSGGPLMTADGRVVGVTSATLTGGQSLNFAVSAALVQAMIDGRGPVTPLVSAAARPIDPADARAYAELFAAMDDAHVREAVAILKSMGPRQKENPIYWFTAGCVHQRLRNFDLAAPAFAKAVELQPDFTEAQLKLAECLACRGKLDDAAAIFENVHKSNPRDVGAIRGLVQIDVMHNDYMGAARRIDGLLKFDPKSSELLGVKAALYGLNRKYKEAVSLFNTAVKLGPKDVSTRVRFGEALVDMGRPKDAMIPLKRAIELEPDNAQAYYMIGEASHALKDIVGARLAWENAQRFDPYGSIGGAAREHLSGNHNIKSRLGVY